MLINPDGSYTQYTFKGSKGTWKLTSVESTGEGSALEAMDTFVNQDREFMTVKRSTVKKLYESKKIWL